MKTHKHTTEHTTFLHLDKERFEEERVIPLHRIKK